MMKIVLDDSRKRLQSEVQKEEEIVGISNVHDQDVEMEDVSNNEAVESVIEESSNKRRRIANSENDGVDVEGTGNTGIAHNNNNAQSVNIGPSVQPSPEIQTDNKPSSQVMETKESSYKIHRVSLDSDTATYVRGLSQASSSQPDDNVTDKHSNNHPNVQISTKMRSAREGNMRFRSSRPPNLVSSVVSMTDSMVSSSLITSSLDLSELEKYDPDHEEPTEHIEPDEKTDLCWKTHMVERIMTDLFVVTAIVLFLFSMTLCLCHQFSTSVIKSAIISAIPFSASSVISNSSSPIPQMTSMSADHFFAPLKQHLWADSLRIPPLSDKNAVLSPDMTLRKYLNSPDGFHLGMAPAFFGFYAYFGALMTLDELRLLPSSVQRLNHLKSVHLKSVSGSSAGAMAASLVSIGLPPRDAAKYVSSLDFKSFADFPGFGGFLKGAKFEQMLRDYIASSHQIPSQKGVESINIENSLIPLAIPVFDVSSMKEVILTEGDMAKATRSSATFPGLFAPVRWNSNVTSGILIDGGIGDQFGARGLFQVKPTPDSTEDEFNNFHAIPKRIVNLSVGSLTLDPSSPPPGPSYFEKTEGKPVESVVSISLLKTPRCGPWAMENGIKAVRAGRKALMHVLDLPMYKGKEENHYILDIDVSVFNLD